MKTGFSSINILYEGFCWVSFVMCNFIFVIRFPIKYLRFLRTSLNMSMHSSRSNWNLKCWFLRSWESTCSLLLHKQTQPTIALTPGLNLPGRISGKWALSPLYHPCSPLLYESCTIDTFTVKCIRLYTGSPLYTGLFHTGLTVWLFLTECND